MKRILMLALVASLAVACSDETNNGSDAGGDTGGGDMAGGDMGGGGDAGGDMGADPVLLYVAAITDTSEGDAACASADPGSDIMGVELEDLAGAKLGFGSIVADSIIADGNDFSSTAHILGDPVDFGGDVCPDFDAATVAALGCGGAIGVEFVDADGNPVALDSAAGQQVRVYEFGSQCPTGSDADSYNLDFCEDTAGAKGGDLSSCIINSLTGAEGEQTGDVAGF